MLKKIILILFFIALIPIHIYAAPSDKQNEINKAQKLRDAKCLKTPEECLEKPTFVINVDGIYGDKKIDDSTTNTKELANKILGTIIQKMMIAMGSISLLIMTIGGGYMIFHSGQDDVLNKGKSIFTGGLIALGVALTSYYMVAILRFILFKGN